MEQNTNRTPSAAVQQAKLRFGIIGNSPSLIAAVERALRVAPIDLSVLVIGESGAGKEFFPQIIHAYSTRKHAKYIAVNCGAIPEGTIDSELFGHEKGAFTGAVDSRKGYFEEASGGTIFLDEVAELPLTTQARLLRVLETGEYLRVGSSEVRRTNVRIVAATNVDLSQAIADERFREDLYYRLSTVLIHVPPLRDRGNDIRLLAVKFASTFAESHQMPPITFGDEAEALLRHYRWPGNVRQLKNIVDQLALFEAGTEITSDTLRKYLPAVGESYMPTVQDANRHSYEREREMLLGMIFNMQRRIDALSQRVDGMERQSFSASHLPAYDFKTSSEKPLITRDSSTPDTNYPELAAEAVDAVEVPAAVTEGDKQSGQQLQSLSDSERDAIRRALTLNEGNRRAAARQLGISERTLYRRIKEYGLE